MTESPTTEPNPLQTAVENHYAAEWRECFRALTLAAARHTEARLRRGDTAETAAELNGASYSLWRLEKSWLGLVQGPAALASSLTQTEMYLYAAVARWLARRGDEDWARLVDAAAYWRMPPPEM